MKKTNNTTFALKPLLVQRDGELIEKEGLYVSTSGEIFRLKKNGNLVKCKGCAPNSKLKYWRFSYVYEGKNYYTYIHRVIMTSFTEEVIPENLEVDHIDNDKNNNSRANLQLLTRKENVAKRNADKKKAKEEQQAA
jgi:hypothetical protein